MNAVQDLIEKFKTDYKNLTNEEIEVMTQKENESTDDKTIFILEAMLAYTQMSKEQLFFRSRYGFLIIARRLLVNMLKQHYDKPAQLNHFLFYHGYKLDRSTVYHDLTEFVNSFNNWSEFREAYMEFKIFMNRYCQNRDYRMKETVISRMISYHNQIHGAWWTNLEIESNLKSELPLQTTTTTELLFSQPEPENPELSLKESKPWEEFILPEDSSTPVILSDSEILTSQTSLENGKPASLYRV
jgi:hypothetical protein